VFLFSDITEDVRFHGFGESRCSVSAPAPTAWIALGDSPKTTRRRIREHCPAAPGVYGMIGLDKRLIYVGMSKSLRDRLCCYFVGRPVSTKVRRIAMEARHVVWEKTGHEWTAWLRELELIRRWQPRLNARGHPARARRAWLCVERGPAARAYLSVRPSREETHVFGPLPAGRPYRRAVNRLNDWFGLRVCRRSDDGFFPHQRELFPGLHEDGCIRAALGTCLGPCRAVRSRDEYAQRVEAAVAFLAGRDRTLLARLHQQMLAAAAERRFEHAARLRDIHQDLARLARFLDRLREVRRCTFVYPVPAHDGREQWHLIHQGHVAAVAPRPRDRSSRRACLRAIQATFGPDDAPGAPSMSEDLDALMLLSRWFRQHPDEQKRTLCVEEALEFAISRFLTSPDSSVK